MGLPRFDDEDCGCGAGLSGAVGDAQCDRVRWRTERVREGRLGADCRLASIARYAQRTLAAQLTSTNHTNHWDRRLAV